jgi:hypothetical protein
MGKNPAVLFYTSDFLSGTILFTDEEVGKYVRLLCLQHQLYPDHIPENHMIFICESYDSAVIKKFDRDSAGMYYNQRMEIEIKKRINYCESRSNNKSGRNEKKSYDTTYVKSYENHMSLHMENDNRNRNDINLNKNIEAIYSEYPRKVGKLAASKKIAEALKKVNFDDLLEKVKKYSESVKGKETKYIPHPSTWFGQGRYLDDVEILSEKTIREQKESGQYQEQINLPWL